MINGKRVIVRSNDFTKSFWIGNYVGNDAKCHNLPVVFDDGDVKYIVAGIVVPWSQKLEDWLNGMEPHEQWNELKLIKQFWRELDDNEITVHMG